MKVRFNWPVWIPSDVRSRQRATAPALIDAGRALLKPICGDRCSVTPNPGNMIFGKDARAIIVRYG